MQILLSFFVTVFDTERIWLGLLHCWFCRMYSFCWIWLELSHLSLQIGFLRWKTSIHNCKTLASSYFCVFVTCSFDGNISYCVLFIVYSTRNAWQSLACSLLGIAMLPPVNSLKLTWVVISFSCTHLSLINSGATGRKLAKFLTDVDGSLLMLMPPLALQSYSPFPNASATNEGGVGQFSSYRYTVAQISNVISGITALKLTKFLLDVEGSSLLLMHPLTLQSPNPFWNDKYNEWRWVGQLAPISGTQVHRWATRFLGLLDRSSPNFYTMSWDHWRCLSMYWHCDIPICGMPVERMKVVSVRSIFGPQN